MAQRKINPGSLFDGPDPLDGSGKTYSALVAQYMATNDDVSTLFYIRARIAAVVGERGVLDPNGKRVKMADIAAEWDVSPSTFSNAKRSFGTLREMGFNVESATPPEGVARAHDIVKDAMRKFASSKVRVALANGEMASGADVHRAIVASVAQAALDSDAARADMLADAVAAVEVVKAATDSDPRQDMLDALDAFQSASDRFLADGHALTGPQAEFLSAALATIATAHASSVIVSTVA